MRWRALLEPALVGAVAIAGWFLAGGRRRNPWKQIRGTPMFIDEEKRIEKGPEELRGMHLADLKTYHRRKARILEKAEKLAPDAAPRAARARYTGKRAFIHAMISRDPQLDGFLHRKHNLDSLEDFLDRRRPFANWGEALAAVVPGSGRWTDVWRSPKVQAWREAAEASADWHGGAVRPPAAVEHAVSHEREELDPELARESFARGELAALRETAREERLTGRKSAAGVPF